MSGTYTGSQAQSGRGTKLSIGAIVAGVTIWTEIGEAKSAPLEGAEWKTDDVSNFDSGVFDEFISTMQTPPEATFTGNRVSSNAGQLAVVAAQASGVTTPFQVILPLAGAQTTTGDTYTFNALVLSCSFTVTTDKAIQYSIKVKKSGAPGFTAGS